MPGLPLRWVMSPVLAQNEASANSIVRCCQKGKRAAYRSRSITGVAKFRTFAPLGRPKQNQAVGMVRGMLSKVSS